MKKEYKVEGMSCNHCRTRVEKALNSIDGVNAIVTLNPPVASIEFNDTPLSTGQLQEVIEDLAGEYPISE